MRAIFLSSVKGLFRIFGLSLRLFFFMVVSMVSCWIEKSLMFILRALYPSGDVLQFFSLLAYVMVLSHLLTCVLCCLKDLLRKFISSQLWIEFWESLLLGGDPFFWWRVDSLINYVITSSFLHSFMIYKWLMLLKDMNVCIHKFLWTSSIDRVHRL